MKKMYNPSIWQKENNEGRRQYIYLLLSSNTGWMHMYNLASCLTHISKEVFFADKKNFHNSSYRRILTADFVAINNDPRYQRIIIHCDKGAKLATREEAEQALEAERREAIKKLANCARKARKANLDAQYVLPSLEEINAFMEGSPMKAEAECLQKKKDCVSNKGGYCIALWNTEFKRDCPFYKNKKEHKKND